MPCLALVTGRFGPHGSFKPNLVRRFGLMFNQFLAVGYRVAIGRFGCDWYWVGPVRVARGGLIRVSGSG